MTSYTETLKQIFKDPDSIRDLLEANLKILSNAKMNPDKKYILSLSQDIFQAIIDRGDFKMKGLASQIAKIWVTVDNWSFMDLEM